jgi:type II secretory pathway pseudopilin PulG
MRTSRTIRRRPQPSEEGYILVAVIFMLAILMISLSVAAPAIKREIQRDREIETMQRGKQYIRAIKMYYKKFGAYPPSADALLKTSEIRFLRKKYIDPTSGKDEWKPIHFGQNKTPTAMGFFGQPLGGSTLAGTGPSGGNGIAGATTLGGSTSPASATTPSATGSPTDPTSGSPGASTTSSTASTGPTFGGGGIIGFSPNSPKPSILTYKKKNHYNEWEFVYDPLADRMTVGGNTGTIGQPAGNIANPTTTPTASPSTPATTPPL